jgi:hypothetical protein
MKTSTNEKINFLKLFVSLMCLLFFNLEVFSNVVATSVYTVFNGSVSSVRTGSVAPDKFNWPHASGVYTIECQISAPYSYSTFQGSVWSTAHNAGSSANYFIQNGNQVQLGFTFQVFSPTSMPPNCSQFTIKYRFFNLLAQLVEDWREINIVRNDYLWTNDNLVGYLTVPDLFLQDKPFNPTRPSDPWDYGQESYINLNTYDYSWVTQSQDIWNRHDNNVASSHLNPMHSVQNPPNTNYLNFTIRNRSCVNTDDASLHLYWTIARFHEPWAHDWFNFNRGNHYADNKVSYSGSDYPMGNEITLHDPFSYGSSEESISISGLASGTTYTYRHPWVVPNPIWYKNGTYTPGVGQYPIQYSSANGNPVICLLARLDEPWRGNNGYADNPSETSKKDIVEYANNNNNVVTRNTYILNSSGGYKWQPINGNPRSRGGEIIVNPPPGSNPAPINIGIIRDTSIYDTTVTPPVFTDHGQINIYLDELLWDRWVEGGMVGNNIEVVDDQIIKVTDPNFATLNNIQLDEGEFAWMATETEYYENNAPAENYDYVYAIGSLDVNTNLLIGSPTNFVATVLNKPTIEDDDGSDTYFTSGIKKVKNQSDISIYPNPASSYIYINLKNGNTGNLKIEMFDSQGMLVQTVDKMSGNSNSIIKLYIDDCANGIYFLKVRNNNIYLTQRFIIKK